MTKNYWWAKVKPTHQKEYTEDTCFPRGPISWVTHLSVLTYYPIEPKKKKKLIIQLELMTFYIKKAPFISFLRVGFYFLAIGIA